jgi:hypothetical protein
MRGVDSKRWADHVPRAAKVNRADAPISAETAWRVFNLHRDDPFTSLLTSDFSEGEALEGISADADLCH